MAKDAKFFRNFQNQILLQINTAMPAKVISYDKAALTAVIQPLFMQKEVGQEPEKLSVIEDVPVLFQKYEVVGNVGVNIPGTETHSTMTFNEPIKCIPALENGDLVYVVCSQRSLDDLETKTPHYAGVSRILDIQDAVIVGVMM